MNLDHDLDVDPHLELDGDVEVDPIVEFDVDFDPCVPRFLDEEFMTMSGRSTCKVKDGVDVYVAVIVKVLGQRRGQPLRRAFQAL